MKLKHQVVSLELAKKLKELGAEQNSYFSWSNFDTIDSKHQTQAWKHKIGEDEYSAFTVGELGEMLPKVVFTKNKNGYYLDISYDNTSDKWRYAYVNRFENECVEMIFDENEADARALMLIYLIENKLLPSPKN